MKKLLGLQRIRKTSNFRKIINSENDIYVGISYFNSLSDVIKMFQKVRLNTLKMNGKTVSAKNRYKEEPKRNFQTEKYNY